MIKKLMTAELLYDLQIVFEPQLSPDGQTVIFSVQHVDRDTEKKYRNLWIVPTTGGEARQFTYGNQTDRHPRWSPDGQEIAFISNRQDETQEQIFIITADGGDEVKIETPYGRKFSASFSPDGRQIAYIRRQKTGSFYQNNALFIVPVTGGESRSLTKHQNLHIDTYTAADIDVGEALSPPVWSRDGYLIYVQAMIRGDQPLLAISTADVVNESQRVIADSGVVGGFSLDASQERIAVLWSSLSKPGQVAVRENSKPGITILTHFNQDLLAQIDLGDIEEVSFRGQGGENLNAWSAIGSAFTAPAI